MNNKNFDKLTNIEVPENWIENALNIPNVVPKKKPLVFPRINRYLAAVACLVLVCTVSLVIVLNINKDVVPVKPMISNGDKNETTTPTNENNVVMPPVTPDNTEAPSDIPTQAPTTENEDTETNKPTEAPLNPNGKPSNPDTEVVKPEGPETEAPPDAPTSKPTTPVVPPTKVPTDELEPPTEEPTDAPWDPDTPSSPPVEPWDPNTPSSPPVEPWDPNTPSSQYPTNGLPPEGSNVFVQIDVSKIPGYTISGEIRLYCEVRDPDNKLLGSSNTFDPKKLVTIYQVKNGKAYGAYSIVNNYNLTKHGRYTANFRDINGNYLCTTYYIY